MKVKEIEKKEAFREIMDTQNPPKTYNVCNIYGNMGPIQYHVEAIIKTLEQINDTNPIIILDDKNQCIEKETFENELEAALGNNTFGFKKILLLKYFINKSEQFCFEIS